MTDWGGKLVGAIARITLLLHMAEHVGSEAPWDIRVATSTVENAIKIGRYAIAHAQAAYAVMGGDEAVEGASHVLAWIEDKHVRTFKQRDAHRALQGRFERADALKAALAVLEERGYVREQPQEQRHGVGRPASPRYDVNPWVHEHPRQANSVKTSILSQGTAANNGADRGDEAAEEVRV
jgi:replicative DNA helicase